jgi:hypothetical protein
MGFVKIRWAGGTIVPAILLLAGSAAAQSAPARVRTISLTLQPRVPITVELEKRVRIKNAGTPIAARVLVPVYVFDRQVIPAGSELQGRVEKIDPIPRGRRAREIANGNFTPYRRATLEFDTLKLKGGRDVRIRSDVSPGAQNVVHLVAGGAKQEQSATHPQAAGLRRQIERRKKQTLGVITAGGKLKWIESNLLGRLPFHREIQAVAAAKAPGRLTRMKAFLAAQLPFHRQFIPAGTHFTVELKTPLTLGSEEVTSRELTRLGGEIPPSSNVHVWLVTPLTSATDRPGTPVEAVVSEPVFTKNHQLILPEGSRLKGRVITARPARRLGRNGKLRFAFQRIVLPAGATRTVEAGLQAADVPRSSHLKLDAEGGARATSSKTKYLAPAITVLLATSSVADSDSRARQIQEGSGNPGEVAGGGVRGAAGFGLIGSVVALVARSRPVTSGFAIYGAAWSVYSHLVARGSEVVFPQGTRMDIRFGSHEGRKIPNPEGRGSAAPPPPKAS